MHMRPRLPFRAALVVAVAFLSMSASCSAQPASYGGPTPPHPGIDVQHYDFHLTLSDTTDRIEGDARIRLRVTSDTLTAIRLDLDDPQSGDETGMTVREVREGDTAVSFEQGQDHLRLLPDGPITAGQERTFTVRYAGVPADGLIIGTNRHGERTFFGDNWPNRARHWLPVVDHPADKASVEWTVTAPERYDVVANGVRLQQTQAEGRRTTRYRMDDRLPTKVMVVGVAEFVVDSLGVQSDVPMQSWVYPQDREPALRDLQVAPRVVRFFEGNIAPFPYEKLANVQSTTRYGGMENAGAIFYSERSLADGEPSTGLVAHEIAHQWFGNTVTETDWPHLWLSEGFATYLAALYAEYAEGTDALRSTMERARRQVLAFQSQNPDEPLVDTTYTDPNELLNTNPYQKGAWVLHMLRFQLGNTAFWSTLQTFYERHEGGNASTSDFQGAVESVADRSFETFFQQWTRRAGYPILEVSWRYDEASKAVDITVEQTQQGQPFEIPLEVAFAIGDTEELTTLDVTQSTETFTVDVPAAVRDITVDPHTWLLGEWTVSPAEPGSS